MGAFSGDSSWRSQTPGQYMLDVVRAAGSFGESFQKSMDAAQDRKHQGKQLDKKLGQDAEQFRDKFIEAKRQFNILHPDPMQPWNAAPITEPPPTSTPPPAETPTGYDQQWKMALPPTFGMMGFAEGGRPQVGEPAVVGERGPEVFVPDRPGTVIANDEIGMRYDGNGTGTFTPTSSTGWDGKSKPNWRTEQPVASWRATNAVDAIGKVTQARTFDDLTKIQAENPEAGMYPQFQNALRQKSMVLEKGESIMLRQKQVENSSLAARSALDLNKRFNDGLLTLPDEFQVAVRSLGEGATNKDGTPSPAAMGILNAGKKFTEAKIAERARKLELVPATINVKGEAAFARPFAGERKDDAKMPQQNVDERKLLTSEMTDMRRELASVTKDLTSDVLGKEETQKLTERATALRGELKTVNARYMQLGTNWQNAASGPAPSEFRPVMGELRVAEQRIAEEEQNRTATVVAPTEPKARKPGTVYQTPKGPLKWTGTGWLPP